MKETEGYARKDKHGRGATSQDCGSHLIEESMVAGHCVMEKVSGLSGPELVLSHQTSRKQSSQAQVSCG